MIEGIKVILSIFGIANIIIFGHLSHVTKMEYIEHLSELNAGSFIKESIYKSISYRVNMVGIKVLFPFMIEKPHQIFKEDKRDTDAYKVYSAFHYENIKSLKGYLKRGFFSIALTIIITIIELIIVP